MSDVVGVSENKRELVFRFSLYNQTTGVNGRMHECVNANDLVLLNSTRPFSRIYALGRVKLRQLLGYGR